MVSSIFKAVATYQADPLAFRTSGDQILGWGSPDSAGQKFKEEQTKLAGYLEAGQADKEFALKILKEREDAWYQEWELNKMKYPPKEMPGGRPTF